MNLKFSLPELEPLADCVKDTGRNIGRSLGCPKNCWCASLPRPRISGTHRRRSHGGKTTYRAPRGRHIHRRNAQMETVQRYLASRRSGNGLKYYSHQRRRCRPRPRYCPMGRWSINGFTAEAAELPYNFLKHVSQRMTNEIREVGGVVYRIIR